MSVSTAKPQTFENHRAFPPAWFFAAGVVLAAEAVRRAWHAIREPSLGSIWAVVVMAALVGVWIASRSRAQIVQDRVIRLEMRLRLERLLGAGRRADIEGLPLDQLIALRFASDTELPALFEETLVSSFWKPDDVKRRVKSWQADWLRI
jgi:hypothetical protein